MIKCLIVGLGNIGLGYDINSNNIQSHAKAISLHKKFYLCGAIEKDGNKRIIFEKKYKKPAYSDFKTAFENIKPDLVVISTPTQTHLLILKKILKFYLKKIIICEKPMGTNMRETIKINNICKKKNIRLYVNYFRLSDPAVSQLRKLLKKPIKGIIIYSRGILNNASHFLNTLQFWFGKIINVKLIKKGKKFGKFDYNSTFIVSFKNVKFIFKPTNKNNKYTNKMIINTTAGKLFYKNGGTQIMWQRYKKNKNNKVILNSKTHKIFSGRKNSQMYYMNNLYKALKGKKNNICNAKRAMDTLKLIHLLYEKK